MKTEQVWLRDSKAESVLKELKISFKGSSPFHLSDVNWKVTLENCGRLHTSLDDSRVEDYSESLQRGDSFPMPIWVQTPAGVVIVSGVHRCKAAVKAGLKTVIGYRAEVEDPKIFLLLGTMANRKEGAGLSKADGLEYALYLIESREFTKEDVARLLRVSLKSIRDRMTVSDLRKKAIDGGSSLASRIKDSPLRNLRGLKDNLTVLARAVDHVAKYRLGEREISDFVKEVKKGKNEQDKLERIDKEGEGMEVIESAPIIKLPTRREFVRALKTLVNLLASRKKIEDLQIVKGSEDENKVLEQVIQLRTHLKRIFGEPSQERTKASRTGTK